MGQLGLLAEDFIADLSFPQLQKPLPSGVKLSPRTGWECPVYSCSTVDWPELMSMEWRIILLSAAAMSG